MGRHVLSILVENHPGVLARISGLFSRRGYNIDSLSVGETEDPSLSRITVAVMGDGDIIEQIRKQVEKLVDVLEVIELRPNESVYRELTLIKVRAGARERPEIVGIVEIFRANIIDVANDSMTVEMTGDQDKIDAFVELMTPYGVAEIVRTGLTAIQRGNVALKEHETVW
jgi:acetolactate synthase-1/3 small subunit